MKRNINKKGDYMMKKILSLVAFVLLLSLCLTSCGLTVPRPEIKEGRFNYSVTYELNGETKTVSGVYICKFDGVSWSLDGGYSRAWKGYIEGGTRNDEVNIGTTEDGGTIILTLCLAPDYFMGEDVVDLRGLPEPYLVITYPLEDADGFSMIGEADVIAEQYGAKIISYEYDEPIQNSFK